MLSALVGKGVIVLPEADELIGVVTVPGDVGAVSASPSASAEGAAARGDSQRGATEPEEGKPRTQSLSVASSSHSSPRVSRAEVNVRVARLKREEQEREKEFQLRRELELRRMELDAATAREIELKKLEAESVFKMRQLELQAAHGRSSELPVFPRDAFDVSKNVQLVPTFRETEVESYFGAFERIACALHWPTDVWAILLQCKLSGKALEACAALSVSDSLNYDTLKGAILRAYELVPEAYRQRFRGLKKSFAQSFVDFAREKALLFDRWCSATKVNSFDALRELVLLEDFKNCLPERILVYLNEQKVSTLQQAAISADEFALTHKSAFKRDPDQKSVQSEKHFQSDFSINPRADKPKQCFYCHKPGHLIADCEALKHKKPMSKPKGVALIKSVPARSPAVSRPSTVSPDECFRPFIFEAFVSVPGEAKRPVKVLRDTGGSQSFILSGILPLGPKTDCNASTVVRGIGLDYVPAPLHNIYIESNLVSGLFPVAVREQFPVDGVEFILGNDIAGGKVYPSPEVVYQPIDTSDDDLGKQHPNVFSVSVLTRAQAKRAQESEVDLCDSVLGPVFQGNCVPPSGQVGNSDQDKPKCEQVEPVCVSPTLKCDALISAQQSDPSIAKCFSAVDNPVANSVFFVNQGVLMREWTPKSSGQSDSGDWRTVFQIVVPSGYRRHVLSLAHEHLWSGHLGVTKTYARILQHFFWPGLKADVVAFCKTCSTCQSVGKPNQVVPPAPLQPVPAVGDPFEHVIVDCVGPLPKTKSGNQFLVTIMCVSTRFPEAVPLRRITASSVTKALTKFFTTFGLPRGCTN